MGTQTETEGVFDVGHKPRRIWRAWVRKQFVGQFNSQPLATDQTPAEGLQRPASVVEDPTSTSK